MGFVDRLSSAAAVAADQASRALDRGKTKASELQVQMKMDAAAKKLGYAVYDGQSGRDADPGMQKGLIDELGRLEGELAKIREEAAAKAAARDAKKTTGGVAPMPFETTPTGTTTSAGSTTTPWGSGAEQGCAPEGAASFEGAPSPAEQAPQGFTGHPE